MDEEINKSRTGRREEEAGRELFSPLQVGREKEKPETESPPCLRVSLSSPQPLDLPSLLLYLKTLKNVRKRVVSSPEKSAALDIPWAMSYNEHFLIHWHDSA